MDVYDAAELWSREKIQDIQQARLKKCLEKANNCEFWRQRFDACGIRASSFRYPEDFASIPFTTKDDLRQQYPYGLLCVAKDEIARMHCSSGTTGNPVAICHTREDISSWADLMARCMHMAGIRKNDVFQNMSGYGLFTGGLGIHFGAERLGCMTIPAGAGNSRRQIKLMQDFGTTVVHILPSYALILAEHLEEMGIDPKSLPLRMALVGAEPYTQEFRLRLQDIYNIKVYNSYGLSEMNGPGVAFECPEQNGMHVWEDAYILEIVDPVTGAALPDGERGELVLSCLCREGMPIFRYRTRDITRIIPGECPCGRRHRRIDRVSGRVDDMFIIKGVNIYPQQVEKILMTFGEVGKNYLIILENEGLGDIMRVQVEMTDTFFAEDMRVLHNLQKTITQRLREEILVTPRVELVQGKTIQRREGKASRVIDSRKSK